MMITDQQYPDRTENQYQIIWLNLWYRKSVPIKSVRSVIRILVLIFRNTDRAKLIGPENQYHRTGGPDIPDDDDMTEPYT